MPTSCSSQISMCPCLYSSQSNGQFLLLFLPVCNGAFLRFDRLQRRAEKLKILACASTHSAKDKNNDFLPCGMISSTSLKFLSQCKSDLRLLHNKYCRLMGKTVPRLLFQGLKSLETSTFFIGNGNLFHSMAVAKSHTGKCRKKFNIYSSCAWHNNFFFNLMSLT